MVVTSKIAKAPDLKPIFLDYIESDGNQFFETGLSMPKGFRTVLKIEFSYLPTALLACIIGAHNNSEPWARNYFAARTGSFEIGLGDTFTPFSNANVSVIYEVDFCNIYENPYCIINGERYDLPVTTAESYSDKPLRLLFINGGEQWFEKAHCRLYMCEIYDAEGILCGEYRPCYDPNGVVCCYEAVSGKYSYNGGTGEFIPGAAI